MTAKPGRDRLGRGLEALLGEYLPEAEPAGDVRAIPLGRIRPNPYQPRRALDEAEIEELAASMRENGLLQPVVVRPGPGGGWDLVAGERRWRAAERLGWTEIPAVVREVDDRTLLVLALVENLQREALGPLEEAAGYRALVERFGLTQEEVARAVGRDRSTVANSLRLLKLPPSLRTLLEEGRITPGHARALLAVPDPARAARLGGEAAEKGWTVRELERRVRALRAAGGRGGGRRRDPALRVLEEELRRVLGTRVEIRAGPGARGRIEIPFYGREDLERLFALLAGREASEVID